MRAAMVAVLVFAGLAAVSLLALFVALNNEVGVRAAEAAVERAQCDKEPFFELERCKGSTSPLPQRACKEFELLTLTRCTRPDSGYTWASPEIIVPWYPDAPDPRQKAK